MCISLWVNTSSSELPVRCVRFGSDGPKFDGDSHTPAPFFRTHWMGLSALLGRDGGLGDSPMCISLRVHTTLANRLSGAFTWASRRGRRHTQAMH